MNKRLGVVLLVGALGCAAQDDGPEPMDSGKPKVSQIKDEDASGGKAEGWGVNDNPGTFASGLVFHVSQLPRSGEAQNIPWASSYWPVYQDNINFKWDGPASESAAAKYGRAFSVAGVEDAVSAYHGIQSQSGRTTCTSDSQCNDKIGESCAIRPGQTSGKCIPTWFGICHAWAPASILTLEPKYPVTHNGVTFKVNDIKALVSLVHDRTSTKFVSLRCNEDFESGDIHFDNYGRPSGDDAECSDTNAATFYILATNYLGIKKQAFVEDRTFDDEVWNQPLRGYRTTRIDNVSAQEANRLVGVHSVGGTTQQRSGSVAAGAWSHLGSFPVAAGQTARVTMTGTGDADLYLSFGAAPTASTYACRPYEGDASEECEVTVPAGATQMFVSVNGYSASSFELAITTGASIPGQYQFNPAAVFFYHVEMEVDYISESSSETDGNLGADINRYTKTDKYKMVLEVNRDGNIIGGEWIEESKKSHPDFLWLPLASASTTVAGGKISYANVKLLLDRSLVPPGGGGGGGVKEVHETSMVTKGAWKHYGPYHAAAGTTLTVNMTGSGDADLYVRRAGAPTATAYDCRPYLSSSAESCSVTGGGPIYVAVNGYAESSNFTFTVRYTEGTGGGGGNPPPASFTHLDTSGAAAQGEMKLFQLPIPAGKKVVIRTTSTKDVDLYIQMDAAPTTDAYLDRGYTDSGNETLTYTATSNGVLHIGVHGYQAGSFTLRTADQ